MGSDFEQNQILCLCSSKSGGIRERDYISNSQQEGFNWSELFDPDSIDVNIALWGIDREARNITERLLGTTFYETLKEYDRETYEMLFARVEEFISDGYLEEEIQDILYSYAYDYAIKRLYKTSNISLMRYLVFHLNIVKKLKKQDPLLCFKYIFDLYGTSEIEKYKNDIQISLDVLNSIIVDAFNKSDQVLYEDAAIQTIQEIIANLGEDALYLDPQVALNSKTNEDYIKTCDTHLKFFDLLFTYDYYIRPNVFRYMCSPK